jgi:hypothetical protein
MDKRSGKPLKDDEDVDLDREEVIHRLLDHEDGESDTFNPRSGEDPGLLPMTEDPLERRQKRTTM